MSDVPRFALPDSWVEQHPLHAWPVGLPSDVGWRRGLAVSLLHSSALYEDRDSFPDVTPGVLVGLTRLGERYYRQHSVLEIWRSSGIDGRGVLSDRLARQTVALKNRLRDEDWLRENTVLGRGEASNGVFSQSLAYAMWCQVLGWHVFTGEWHLADRIIDQTLSRLEPLVETLADPGQWLDRLLPSGIQPDFDFVSEGPDHDKKFIATIRVRGYPPLSASSGSKKNARKAAAAAFLMEHFSGALPTAPDSVSRADSPISSATRLGQVRDRQLRGLRGELGLSIEWEGLLDQALIHTSWTYENQSLAARLRQTDNGRLAFVGSHTIDLEGCLVTVREVLASRPDQFSYMPSTDEMSAEAADVLALPSLMLLGRGQQGKFTQEIMADAFQAVHAVATIAQNGSVCLPSAQGRWRRAIEVVAPDQQRDDDWRTLLQEYCAGIDLVVDFDDEDAGADHEKQYRSTAILSSPPLRRRGRVVGSWASQKRAGRGAACKPVVEALRDLSSSDWCLAVASGDQASSALHTFLLNHLLASAPTEPRRLRRWRTQEVFGSGYLADAVELTAWAEAVDVLCRSAGVEASAADTERLAAHFRMLLAQQQNDDPLVASLLGLGRRIQELAETESPDVQQLDVLVRDVAWLTAALRGRSAEGAVQELGDFLTGLSMLRRISIRFDTANASLPLDARGQDAISLWVRGTQDLHPGVDAFVVEPVTNGIAMRCEGWANDPLASETLIDLVETIDSRVDARTSPDACLTMRNGPSRDGNGGGPVSIAVQEARASSRTTVDSSLSSLLHDIKNELSAASAADRLDAAGRTEIIRQRLIVSEHLDRAGALMEDILSRTGLLRVSLAGDCDVASALRNYVMTLLPSLPGSIRLDFDPPAENMKVPIPESTFRALMENAVRNSLEAMNGVGALSIHCQVLPDEGALVEVADSGPGFEADVLDEFQRGEMASRKKAGNGIGLLTMRQVARAIGGEVTLANGTAGARIVLTFPALADDRPTPSMDD